MSRDHDLTSAEGSVCSFELIGNERLQHAPVHRHNSHNSHNHTHKHDTHTTHTPVQTGEQLREDPLQVLPEDHPTAILQVTDTT